MAQSFLEGMRMNSIYPPSGQQQQPDLISQYTTQLLPIIHGEQDRQMVMNQRLMNQIRSQHQMDAMPFNNAQPDVRLGSIPGTIAPLDMAKLKQGEEKIQNTKAAKEGELGFKKSKEETDSSIRQQRADTYSSMHDLPDSEKLDLINRARRGDIEARGIIQRDLLDTKGEQATGLEKIRQTGRTELENTRQTGRTDLAAMSNEARQHLQDTRPDRTNTPYSQAANYNNKARQLKNTDSNMGQFITFDPSGRFLVTSPDMKNGPDEETYHRINQAIYGTNTEDINLPAEGENKKPSEKKPETKSTPTSKYKVTVTPAQRTKADGQ